VSLETLMGAEVWAKDAEATTQMASADTNWRGIPGPEVNALLVNEPLVKEGLINAENDVAGNRECGGLLAASAGTVIHKT
jgi:hypothetical protein